MPPPRQQLPLPFPHEPGYDPLDFLPAASNQDALAWLDRVEDWPDRRLALWGQAGCGKTHMLRTWARRTHAISLNGPALGPLESVPPATPIALDDADLVAPDTALLHLLNTARDHGAIVLMTGRTPPARWPVRLPDLTSRLRAVTAVEIGPPDDDLLRALLLRLLADRQLVASQSVQEWLLLRLPRSPAALRDAVARLDRLSLADRKPITRALAARLLGPEGTCQDDEVSITDRVRPSQPSGFL